MGRTRHVRFVWVDFRFAKIAEFRNISWPLLINDDPDDTQQMSRR